MFSEPSGFSIQESNPCFYKQNFRTTSVSKHSTSSFDKCFVFVGILLKTHSGLGLNLLSILSASTELRILWKWFYNSSHIDVLRQLFPLRPLLMSFALGIVLSHNANCFYKCQYKYCVRALLLFILILRLNSENSCVVHLMRSTIIRWLWLCFCT